MATLTRGAVTLAPALVLPVRLTRPSRSVVHPIINDVEPDITSRTAGLRAGDVQCLFVDAAAAIAAVNALTVVGGPWTIANSGDVDGTYKMTGDVIYEPAGDGVRSRLVTVGVQEVSA